jgi:membrane-bound lytic murein transglycosylase B
MFDGVLKKVSLRLNRCGVLILLCLLVGLCAPVHAAIAKAPFNALEKRLIKDGFDTTRIETIFANPAVAFEERGVSAYFMHNEATLNYAQFTRPHQISLAKKYMQAHRKAFSYAEKMYGVNKEVITAIILVETKFGRYVGNKSVLNTLATLSAMKDKKLRQIIWKSLPDDGRRITRRQFERKADRKSTWAYRELKAFLTYTQREGMDPTTIKGSYAGAMGISQFMPSNIVRHGRDGNHDGRVDLFEDADAISSIASYLKYFGWGPGISRKEEFRAVYHYNHSKYYVNTVLEIAKKLKG